MTKPDCACALTPAQRAWQQRWAASLPQREEDLRTGWRALHREQDRMRRQVTTRKEWLADLTLRDADLDRRAGDLDRRDAIVRRREAVWARFDRERDATGARARYLRRRSAVLDALERQIQVRQSRVDHDARIAQTLTGARRFEIPPTGWAVYQAVAAGGRVLYVGMTRDVRTRLAGHRRTSWYRRAHALHVEYFPTADGARWRERELIRHLAPPGNTAGLEAIRAAEDRA